MAPGNQQKVKCGACQKNESGDMVMCDNCGEWSHFECVGMTSELTDQPWSCRKCKAAKNNTNAAPKAKGDDKVTQGDEVNECGTIQSRRSMRIELKNLEEQREAEMRYIEKKRQIMLKYVNGDESGSEGSERLSEVRAVRTSQWAGEHGDACINKSLLEGVTLTLTAEQISARQVVPRELPIFSGRAEEWPLFYSSFQNSTRLCGFSDDENLLRLQRALKGKAFDYVSSKLMVPALVPEILATLQMVFGKPEHIINNLLAKLRCICVNANKLDSLVTFALEIKNLIATIEASGLRSHMNNPLLIQELIEKLPPPLRLQWALASKGKRANLKTFGEWMYELAEAASSVTSFEGSQHGAESEKRKTQRVNFHREEQSSSGAGKPTAGKACYHCKDKHSLVNCEKFKALSIDEKWHVVRNMNLCGRCLIQHDYRTCKERKECGTHGCTMRHHPLLHNQTFQSKAIRAPGTTSQSNTNKGQTNTITEAKDEVVAVHHHPTSSALFRIVPVTLYSEEATCETYAFLDDGSGPTLIEKGVLQQLSIKGPNRDLCLRWTDGTVRREPESEIVNVEISGRGENKKRYMLNNVRSVTKLELPEQTLNMQELASKYSHLRGLPVKSYKAAKPQMIIGLSNKEVAMPMKFREGRRNEPAATKTRLGWTIYGMVAQEPNKANESLNLHVCECDDEVSLQRLVRDYINSEETVEDKQRLSHIAIEQETKMAQNVRREGDHFVVKLLWKSDKITLPDNYLMALGRLQCFERKLKFNTTLKNWVIQHIIDMQSKGYIRKLSLDEVEENHPRKWYLPTFNVINPNKPEKKRMVWDAAAKYQGVSLNDCLSKGPDLLNSLSGVLINFRIGRIGISGDIREMFLRVFVDEADQHSQRFLWRDCDSNRPPDVYLLRVLSFGATCSPSLAQTVKNVNAREHEPKYPRAVKCIIERHYVDDMLDSVDTVEEAIKLASEVQAIHKKANFYIRNWVSNSKEVMQALGEASKASRFCLAGRRLEQTFEVEKVLGLHWQTETDSFTFDLKFTRTTKDVLDGSRLPTKRELLRLMMSIFDPLGMLTFFTVGIKILFQRVWRSGIGWDEALPVGLADDWRKWLSTLDEVRNVKIPRCYFVTTTRKCNVSELHIFVDASENAYAAVAFLRTRSNNNLDVSFVCSKSKVAPLRPLSIPRLELLAAIMGVRLGDTIKKTIDLDIKRITYWSDSKTVLSWIHSEPRDYKQFVMFRIAEIQELSETQQWRYVPTKLNVADLGTKSSNAPDFTQSSPWFRGAAFLHKEENFWPNTSLSKIADDDELKPRRLLVAHMTEDVPVIDVYRFSKWERLVRSMAYVKRAILVFARLKKGDAFKGLTTDDLVWGERYLCRLAQAQSYEKEISLLRSDPCPTLPKHSPLRKLSPFIDKENVLRMKSRLDKATCISDSAKNPIILPRNSHVTALIVDWYHRKWKHLNHETVINEIFQKYHIPGLRRLLRTIRNKCQLCMLKNANPKAPEMGNLPEARLAAYSRPFSHVGIDYFGPYNVTIGRRSEKRYGVVFTCLTCRAVHLEIAYSLTTSSCCIVIRNFIARRGVPKLIYSDNGTNLKAAERELRESLAEVDFHKLQVEFTTSETEWVFIPPAAPHMGGAWERMVRSIKTVLNAIMSTQRPVNDEQLHNLFCEVESILNSRPLTYLSLETANEEALTPNHFLLGSSAGGKPPGKFDASDAHVKASWRHSQYLADCFWKRWVKEVLPTMTRRTKWFDKVKPIEENDVVIIVDPNSPRNTWPKGIVISTVKAKDGQVRSAIVRTAQGQYHRPATRLAVLDVQKSGS